MRAEQLLSRRAKILTEDQRKKYFTDGYVGVEGLVDGVWLESLKRVTEEFVQISRGLDSNGFPVSSMTGSTGSESEQAVSRDTEQNLKKDRRFDLEPDHVPEKPRIRRLNSPIDHHETYWKFASEGPFVDVAEDLLGPNVKFHHAKLNFKWGGGGEEVKWHQDIQFWPHTNYDVLTIGIYLDDVAAEMAPMGVIPQSHEGPLYDLYNAEQKWTGNIQDSDIGKLDIDRAEYLGGPAGSITVHNCRSVHGSPPNQSDKPRPLLLCAYSSADALPITNLTTGGKYAETIVRGEAARWARFDARPVLLPPDWSKIGFKSIFEHQQKES